MHSAAAGAVAAVVAASEVDGLEADDDFYVLSTPVGVITRIPG